MKAFVSIQVKKYSQCNFLLSHKIATLKRTRTKRMEVMTIVLNCAQIRSKKKDKEIKAKEEV